MIVRYCELNKEYHFKINMECADVPRDSMTNTQMKHDLFFKRVANEIRTELSQFGYTDSEITDILVKLSQLEKAFFIIVLIVAGK